MALTAALNRTTFTPGEQITLTVTTGAGERGNDQPITVTVTVPGVGETVLTGTLNGPDIPVSVSDPDRLWVQQSDNGSTAVFTSTA